MSKTDMLCAILRCSGALAVKAWAVCARGWPYLTILAYHRVLRGGQRTEDRGQRTEGRGQRAEDRGQRAEDRGQRIEGRGQRTEGRG